MLVGLQAVNPIHVSRKPCLLALDALRVGYEPLVGTEHESQTSTHTPLGVQSCIDRAAGRANAGGSTLAKGGSNPPISLGR